MRRFPKLWLIGRRELNLAAARETHALGRVPLVHWPETALWEITSVTSGAVEPAIPAEFLRLRIVVIIGCLLVIVLLILQSPADLSGW